ncbi:hypothetical protein ACFC96_13180 [Streptomyces sp. NPDC055955]|uniref:hypothetical protein n=1 Tax=Streptomyces sp. NPDC055955 TaxID=3345665 RepID=UPI0035E0CD64
MTVPADTRPAKTIHIIFQVTQNGPHALSPNQRVVITVKRQRWSHSPYCSSAVRGEDIPIKSDAV